MNKKTKGKNKGMKGFEELYESYLNDADYATRLKLEKENNRSLDQYELQHFLEQENNRLANLETFFTKKIPAKMNFPQTENLIAVQKERKNFIMEKTMPALTKLSSQFQINMAQLFNSHFG